VPIGIIKSSQAWQAWHLAVASCCVPYNINIGCTRMPGNFAKFSATNRESRKLENSEKKAQSPQMQLWASQQGQQACHLVSQASWPASQLFFQRKLCHYLLKTAKSAKQPIFSIHHFSRRF